MKFYALFQKQQIGGALLKRIFAFFLSLLLILGICPMSALADTGGSGNVDGGGGSMGQGTSQNSWNPGMDGVRVTVIYSETQKRHPLLLT